LKSGSYCRKSFKLLLSEFPYSSWTLLKMFPTTAGTTSMIRIRTGYRENTRNVKVASSPGSNVVGMIKMGPASSRSLRLTWIGTFRGLGSQFHQHFTRKFFVRISPQSQNLTREKLLKQHSYKKFVRKMLMKLMAGVTNKRTQN